MVTVTAHIRESRRDLGEGRVEHQDLEVRAESYEQAKGLIGRQLPSGWIVCSFRVDRGLEHQAG